VKTPTTGRKLIWGINKGDWLINLHNI